MIDVMKEMSKDKPRQISCKVHTEMIVFISHEGIVEMCRVPRVIYKLLITNPSDHK